MKHDRLMCHANNKLRIRFIVPGYPTFNIYSTIAKYTTALGPVMLASVAAQKAGWEVEIIDENNFTAKAVKDSQGRPDHSYLQQLHKADVVAFYGGLSSTIPRLYEIAKFYDKQGVVTIAGGQHFSKENVKEGLSNHLDYLVFGEGEHSISELMDAWNNGTDFSVIKGLAYEENGNIVITDERPPLSVEEIVSLPLPDFSLLRHAKLSLYPVSWMRGCCMNCEFCTVKGNVRYPPSDYLFTQVVSLYERFGAVTFFIVDDLFSQKREETLDFCRKISRYQERLQIKFHFTVQIRLDKAGDQELLVAMRRANIKVLAIGFESPIPEELKAMNKCLRPEEMIKNTALYHRAGFLIHGMFIFGYPAINEPFLMSSKDRGAAYRNFIRKAGIDTIQILLPVPLPGTELTERLAEQHRIFSREDIGWEFYDGNFQLFEPDKPLDAVDVQETAKKLMVYFYRFNSLFSIGIAIATFPLLIFHLFNLRKGWRLWFRKWRNALWRFIGWRIIRNWKNCNNSSTSRQRLCSAQDRLLSSTNISVAE